jgi:hypothetical protein
MCHKGTWVFMLTSRYSRQILMKFEFSRQGIRKMLKFYENPSSGSGVLSCGQTDGRTERQT